jgi:hypothetical protein
MPVSMMEDVLNGDVNFVQRAHSGTISRGAATTKVFTRDKQFIYSL